MSREDNKTAPKQRNDMRTRSDAVTTKNVDMASMLENAFHTMETLQPATEVEIKTLQGELKTKLLNMCSSITDLQSELEEKRKQHIENRYKSAQDITRLNDELKTAKMQSTLDIYWLKDELETARYKSAQDIARLNDELKTAKMQSKQEIYGLKDELETARMKSTHEICKLKAEQEIARYKSAQDIARLNDELKTAKLSEQKWMDKVKQLEKNSERSKSAQDGRPDIQDLSDSNRPSKLAERFSELYDDEWTNCYDTARKQFSTEQSAVQMLLRTCVKIYNSCTFIASKDVHDLQRAFSTFSEAQDDVLLIQMKQRRKRPRQVDIDIKRITPDIGDSVADMLGPDLIKNQHVRAFWVKCLEICWLLVIQDPPVYMDTEINKQGRRFDHAAYRPYTQTGNEFDFVVWPALYIHHGGDILYKGVAQGKGSLDSVGGKRRSSLVKK